MNLKTILAAAIAATALALPQGTVLAAEGVALDEIEVNVTDLASLQSGARTFVNYCLGCHSASLMRYNALRGIGLTDDQIRDNLMFTADKVGLPMAIAMRPKDAKEWFGTAPPDLSVIARARGADWLYTYLRAFYRDASSPTGWNNKVVPNVAMTHVLWQLQGMRGATVETVRVVRNDAGAVTGHTRTVAVFDRSGLKTETMTELPAGAEFHEGVTVKLARPEGGRLSTADYDRVVSDLVTFLVWMGEPHQTERRQVGVWVLFALAVLIFLSYFLKRAYWKDVH